MALNYAYLLTQSATAHGSRPAVFDGSRLVSYAELSHLAGQFASEMTECGLSSGDRVALLLDNGADFMSAYWGALRAGLVVVPLNPQLSELEIANVLRDSGSSAFVYGGPYAGKARAASYGMASVRRLLAGRSEARSPGNDEDDLDLTASQGSPSLSAVVNRQSDDPAVILYTSGTTGRPKGALLTHANLAWTASIVGDRCFDLAAQDVVGFALPLSHVMGQVAGMGAAVQAGAAVAVVPRFEVEAVLDLIEERHVSVFLGVPTMYNALVQEPRALASRDLSSLRLCISGGATASLDLLRRFEALTGLPIVEGYGLSETSSGICFNPVVGVRKAGSVGVPTWATEMKVLGYEGSPAPPGAVGEICVRSPAVMAGYFGDLRATEAVLGEDGWLRTGDLGYMDHDGYFFVVGRIKDVIIRGGYNVYPREIEDLLAGREDIREAAVIGVPHHHLGEEVVAVIVSAADVSLDPGEVQDWLRTRVAAYKYPRHVLVLDELPKNATGKILKRLIDVSRLDLAATNR